MSPTETQSTGVVRPPRRRLSRSRLWEEYVLPYAMLAPTVIGLMLLIIFPLLYSGFLSLYSWRLTEIRGPKTFAALANYSEILADEAFWNALRNTFVFVIGTVTVELVLGFFVALLLSNIFTGRRLASSIILLPMIITPVVVGLIWRYMYDPQFGVVNYVLGVFGVKQDIGWLSRENLALAAVMLVDIWELTPFVILILHAGIISVPEDLMDAAKVDGAAYRQFTRFIIIPYVAPLLLLVVTLRTMDTLRVFDIIYVLTKGGPGRATETIAMYTYQAGFIYFRMGYAMALSIVMLLVILIITLFYLRIMRVR